MDLLGFIEYITWAQVFLFIIGLGLVIFEMFHPGFGASGITGGILLLAGIIMTAKSVLDAIIMIIIVLTILGIALAIMLRSAAKGRLSRILILSESQKKSSGYISTENLENFLGREGTVISTLRPSGTVDFDGIRLDVVSEGEFIMRRKKVKVVKVEGRRIVVREVG